MTAFRWFSEWSPVLQPLPATIFTSLMTAFGASLVFFFRKINRNLLNGMSGFAAGVILMRPLLPSALASAAGAMIFVVVEELIPEARLE